MKRCRPILFLLATSAWAQQPPPATTPTSSDPFADLDDPADMPADPGSSAPSAPDAIDVIPDPSALPTEADLGTGTNEEDFTKNEGLLNPEDGVLPDDVRQLEQRLEQASGAPEAQQVIQRDGLGEPGEGLMPSEQFARIPLRPPMSDSNWNKWAGPMSRKSYKIRGGNTLWSISQRLFGTPYLWPKIWHLNARFTNPHLIEKGIELSFNPGNPNSAPELAYRDTNADSQQIDIFPQLKLERKLTLLELVDETLRRQIKASHPPFQHFLLDTPPDDLAKVPPLVNEDGRVYYREGDGFKVDMKDGIYPIARIVSYTDKLFRAYRVRWIAVISVRNDFAEIVRAFTEISANDLILDRDFRLTPLAIHREIVGPNYRKQMSFVPLQEGGELAPGEHQLVGVRFPNTESGPRPGAILEIIQGYKRKSLALLVDRDRRVGTLWIIRSDREVVTKDEIQ
jgi:hypothetical protein